MYKRQALALDVAQSEAGVPVLGLIDAVARQVKQQRIGVLATDATAASGAYGRALQAQRQGLTVVEMGCPAFVPAVEAHQLDTPQLRGVELMGLHGGNKGGTAHLNDG